MKCAYIKMPAAALEEIKEKCFDMLENAVFHKDLDLAEDLIYTISNIDSEIEKMKEESEV